MYLQINLENTRLISELALVNKLIKRLHVHHKDPIKNGLKILCFDFFYSFLSVMLVSKQCLARGNLLWSMP